MEFLFCSYVHPNTKRFGRRVEKQYIVGLLKEFELPFTTSIVQNAVFDIILNSFCQ